MTFSYVKLFFLNKKVSCSYYNKPITLKCCIPPTTTLSLSLNCVHEEMRDQMERLVVLPFSGGCVSQSSVAAFEQHPRRSKSEPNSSAMRGTQEEEEIGTGFSMKNSLRFLALPKPNISTGFQRLFKTFKSFSQLFVYKEEMEEVEMEMEIGCPTDVKHVTHIGYDGSATTNPIRGWDNLIPPELLSSIPSVSLIQFEHDMAAQDKSPIVA